MSADRQNEVLANYIMRYIPGYPRHSEGAGDTAIRLLKMYREALAEIVAVLHHPPDYPSSIAKIYEIAIEALNPSGPGQPTTEQLYADEQGQKAAEEIFAITVEDTVEESPCTA